MKLSLIFPTYNEAESITAVLTSFSGYCTINQIDHEIIVVNDGSRDATSEKIKDFAAIHPSIQIINHSTNQGYGAALRSGFSAARGDFIFFTDSDGQFRPDDLDHTWPLINPATIILGYRQPRAEGFMRRLNAVLWGRFVGLVLGFRVRDVNCAWKLFPRSMLDKISLVSRGAFISTELLYFARKIKLQFKEIPVRHYPRNSGRSTGANPHVIWLAFREVALFIIHR